MRESGLWGTMKRNLGSVKGLHMVRLENSAGNGTPDVNGCYRGQDFWAELKYLAEFPVRPSTVVRIPHFTDEQRLWLKSRGEAGGLAWLFVQVGREYLLFDHVNAQEIGVPLGYGSVEFREAATARWVGRCDWGELLNIISGRED